MTTHIDWTTETITQEAVATVQVEGEFGDSVATVQDMLAAAYGDDTVTVLDTGIHVQMPAARLLDHREVIDTAITAAMS